MPLCTDTPSGHVTSHSPLTRGSAPAARIRPARPADLPAIVDVYNASIPGRQATADLEPVALADRLPWFEKHDQQRPLWVADGGLAVLAWLSLEDFYGRPAYRRTAEVSVYVAPTAQKRGVGSALLVHAITHAPALGLEVLVAFVFGHNTDSLQLFERYGFTRSGVLAGVAELDGVLRDLVILTHQLGGHR